MFFFIVKSLVFSWPCTLGYFYNTSAKGHIKAGVNMNLSEVLRGLKKG